MSETSRRRRLLGRSLIATGALALPLTASISYSAAVSAQEPEAPAAPSVASPELPPSAPEAPATAQAPEVRREVQTIVTRSEGDDGEHTVHRFTMRRDGDGEWVMPEMPEMPDLQFRGWGDPADPEFQARMEEWSRQMERWGEENGQRWEQWAEQHREQALALAENTPVVINSCDENEQADAGTDGRRRIVICQRQIDRQVRDAERQARMAERQARSSLRQARNSIANNPDLSPQVRNEILADLDDEIERIERADD